MNIVIEDVIVFLLGIGVIGFLFFAVIHITSSVEKIEMEKIKSCPCMIEDCK